MGHQKGLSVLSERALKATSPMLGGVVLPAIDGSKDGACLEVHGAQKLLRTGLIALPIALRDLEAQ